MQGTHMLRRDRTCQLINAICGALDSTQPHHHKENENLSVNGRKTETQAPVTIQPVLDHLFLTPIPKVRKESKMTEKSKRLIPTKKEQSKSSGQA